MTAPATSERARREDVAARWGETSRGKHYARGRFRSARRRARDGRLVAALLGRSGVGPAPVARLLDVPCGTGRLAAALRGRAVRLVGVDVSRAMLTAEGATFALGDVRRVQASAFALPFQDRSFDVVVACRLLHHFAAPDDRRAILRECARVASRFVLASYWDAASWHAWRRRTTGPLRRRGHDARVAVRAAALDADLAAAGLTPLARAHSLRFVSPQTFVLAAARP